MKIPLELIDLICSKIIPELLIKICDMKIIENTFYFLNKNRIEKISRIDKWKNTELYMLARDGDFQGVKYMTRNGLKNIHDHQLAVSAACIPGDLEMVKYLISLGSNINIEFFESIVWASSHGHLHIVKYLVEIGADIRIRGDRAILCASGNGHLEIVKYLVSQGADISHDNCHWPLKNASDKGHLEIVKYILSIFNNDPKLIEWSISSAKIFKQLHVIEYLENLVKDLNGKIIKK